MRRFAFRITEGTPALGLQCADRAGAPESLRQKADNCGINIVGLLLQVPDAYIGIST
jgi:hypothetical protein